jgi:hypothetical protein
VDDFGAPSSNPEENDPFFIYSMLCAIAVSANGGSHALPVEGNGTFTEEIEEVR